MEEKQNQILKKRLKADARREKYIAKKIEESKLFDENDRKVNQMMLTTSKEAFKKYLENSEPNPDELKFVLQQARKAAPEIARSMSSAKTMSTLKDNMKIQQQAVKIHQEGMRLSKKNDYPAAIKKILESIALADNAKAIDDSIVFRLSAIILAMAENDIETALIQTINLDTTFSSSLFKNFVGTDFGRQMGSKITKEHLMGAYIQISECFMYLGNLQKSKKYLEKGSGVLEEWENNVFDKVNSILAILLPRQETLRTKIKIQPNLEGIIPVISSMENECIHLLHTRSLDEADKLIALLEYVIEVFSILNFYKDKKSEVFLSYQKLLEKQTKAKLNIGDKLFSLFKEEKDTEIKEKLKNKFLRFFEESLEFAQENKIQGFIFISSSLLVEYYSTTLVKESVDCLENEKAPDYLKYLKIRTSAAKALDKTEKRKENRRNNNEKAAVTFLPERPENTQPEQSETTAYQRWQKAYNATAAKITSKSLIETLDDFKKLQDEYKELNQQAQIHYGIAECYYFNSQSFKKVIVKIENCFKQLEDRKDTDKKDIWIKLETNFYSIKQNFLLIIQNLEAAIYNLNLCMKQSQQFIDTNSTLKIEYQDITTMIAFCKEVILDLQELNTSVHDINKNFINEMQTKKSYLQEIGKYGFVNNGSGTGEMVRTSIEQDCVINKINQNADKLLDTANELEKSVKTKSKSLGMWYMTKAEDVLKLHEYDTAYTYYLQACTEFENNNLYCFMAITETKLAWLKAIKVDLTQDLHTKKELTLSSLKHSKSAVQAYQRATTGINDYSKYIETIQQEITKKENFIKVLGEKLVKNENSREEKISI